MDELHYQIDLLKAMNQKISSKERMYRLICDESDQAFIFYSFERDEVFMLGKFREYFSFEIRDIRNLSRIADAMNPESYGKVIETLYPERDGKFSSEYECQDADNVQWYRISVKIIRDEKGNVTDKVIMISNTTQSHNQNSELMYMAYYDGITGLFNRNHFIYKVSEYITNAEKEHVGVAVMVLDIDDFQRINDSQGLAAGDEVLQLFGDYLGSLMDDRVAIGHLSDAVFGITIYNPLGIYNISEFYRKIHNRLQKPITLSNGTDLNISLSVGVANYPEAAGSPLELINCADIALYSKQNTGKDGIRYFDAPILNAFLKNVELDNRLKEAAFHNHFELYFQPQFYTGNKKLRGMEALIRWKDEQHGMISPATFIPIAEKNGTIISIGRFVVEESIAKYAKWSKQYNKRFFMSINISALQYKREDFVDSVISTIRRYHVDPSDIELEITESILIDDLEAVSEKLCILRNFGLHISLDDFGTGYSSLSYLKRFPIDTLKIDKSFTDTVLGDSSTRIITESILSMAHSMGFETIAEGVESEQQYKYLHAVGCDVIQGFFLSKPMPSDDIEGLLSGM